MFVNILTTIITTLVIGACSDQNSAFNASTSSRKKRPVEDELEAFGETFEEAEEKEKEKECQEGNQGRIIVSHDEWVFSDTGFDKAPDAAIFIKTLPTGSDLRKNIQQQIPCIIQRFFTKGIITSQYHARKFLQLHHRNE